MPVNLEVRTDCGFCGEAVWLYQNPVFRLYADGTVVFREPATDNLGRYRTATLDEALAEALLREAWTGALRDADEHYPSNTDDLPVTVVEIDAIWMDDAAVKTVQVDSLGPGESAPPARKAIDRLVAVLGSFDDWLRAHDIASTEYEPRLYAAGLLERETPAGEPWPWPDLSPTDFAEGHLVPVAAVPPALVDSVGLAGTGGAVLPAGAFDVLVRPVLPGDDQPGAFGLRPDTVAVTTTDGLRVRSLPEVSDRSAKLEPLLDEADALYILDGPVAGSGYRWYKVLAPEKELIGWVASASRDGERWLRPLEIQCTLGASSQDELDELGHEPMLLACYRGVPIDDIGTLRRADTDCEPFGLALDPRWLGRGGMCHLIVRHDEPETGSVDLLFGSRIHPEALPAAEMLLAGVPDGTGVRVQIVGQLDHPDARDCRATAATSLPPELVVLGCRATFVITGIQPAD